MRSPRARPASCSASAWRRSWASARRPPRERLAFDLHLRGRRDRRLSRGEAGSVGHAGHGDRAGRASGGDARARAHPRQRGRDAGDEAPRRRRSGSGRPAGLSLHHAQGAFDRPALAQLAPLVGPQTTIVSGVNGVPWWYAYRLEGPFRDRIVTSVDPDGRLWRELPPSQALGCIVYPAAEIAEPGVIHHTYGDRFTLGEPDGSRSERAGTLSALMIKAGLKAPVRPRIRDDLWVKLWGNMAFNPLSALTGATLDVVVGDAGTRAAARAMMLEGQAVAEALGVRFSIDVDKRIEGAAEVGRHKTSMLQDLETAARSRSRPCLAPSSRWPAGSMCPFRSRRLFSRSCASAPRCADRCRIWATAPPRLYWNADRLDLQTGAAPMSFLKSLFGGSKAPAAPAGPLKSLEHAGFTIHATPYQEAGQYQLCGVVEKEIDGVLRSHRFVRADRFPGAEEAADFALVKGQQLIDQQGETIFK